MKITVCLALLPLAAQAALPANSWVTGRRGLALVAREGPNGFTFATRDGGSGSASFKGEAPKGGSFINDAIKDAEEVVKDAAPTKSPTNNNDVVPKVGPFWESKLFKEGGLGFLFGVGTGVCARKANKGAAYAVTGALVAAQYMSRADIFGCGGKLGWPKLGYFEQREFVLERENFGFLWRARRSITHTVRESLETCEGYALGLALGLKGPIP